MAKHKRKWYACRGVAVKSKDRSLFGGGRPASDEEAHRLRAEDKDLSRELDELEKDLDELRATYELFFMGIEKVEPQPQRDLVKSKLRRFRERSPRNTALKFRIQQLKARMVSLENYWQRTLRQKEAGSYFRDVARRKRREADRARSLLKVASAARQGKAPVPSKDGDAGGSSVASDVLALGGQGSSASRDAPRTGPGGTSTAATPRPRVSSPDELTDANLRKLYDTYIGARRRCGESTDLRYEDMAGALKKQIPQLMTKTGATSVEFKVVIRGGKAVLKALPRLEE